MAASSSGVISRPHEVWWAGFRSTTTQLQQAGWEISAEQCIHLDAVRLAMRHRDCDLYAVSNPTGVDRFSYSSSMGARPLVFKIAYVASGVHVQVIDNFSGFAPIDAKPQFIDERKSIEDFNIFATPLARTKELIVDQDEVADVMCLLERIKTIQAPEQKDIRAREARRGDASPRQVFHAQILSFSDRVAA